MAASTTFISPSDPNSKPEQHGHRVVSVMRGMHLNELGERAGFFSSSVSSNAAQSGNRY
jgi:hypothetical protein